MADTPHFSLKREEMGPMTPWRTYLRETHGLAPISMAAGFEGAGVAGEGYQAFPSEINRTHGGNLEGKLGLNGQPFIPLLENER